MYPIIDLHCDLLGYLEDQPGSTPDDVEKIGCALPHLRAGGVKLQVCALFATSASGSSERGMKQGDIFRDLVDTGKVKAWEMRNTTWEKILADDAIYVIPAIENASVFSEEEEKVERCLYRLEMLLAKIGKPLYISLTHNEANRFGGGNMSQEGLLPDGAVLLEYLDKRDIAVDLSHTSPKLAHDIFKYIAARELDIPIIASHSNFQEIVAHPRNLPDPYVEYLRKKDGIQGINFIKDFVGPDDHDMLYTHFAHGQKMGIPMAFAADFFPVSSLPPEVRRPNGYFFPELHDASVYPEILEKLSASFSEDEVKGIAHGNALAFLKRLRFFADKWAKPIGQ